MKRYKSIFTSNLLFILSNENETRNRRFLRKEVGQAIISEVVSKLLHDRYINDKEYAILYTRTQSNVNRKGPTVIKRELLNKGVQDLIITHSLQEYPKEKQIENALILIEKKKNLIKSIPFTNEAKVRRNACS